MRNRGLTYRLATASVTMKSGRIPWPVLLTALLPVVLGAFVCSPHLPSELAVSREQTVQALLAITLAQHEQLTGQPISTPPDFTHLAMVCLTKGADVWTVFDGGVRSEQDMRRLVWDRFPSAGRQASPFADPLAFQPMDEVENQLSSSTYHGIGEDVMYVWYDVDLAPGIGRHFRIWGDHWYLDIAGDASGQYRLSIQAVSPGRDKAKQVAALIKGAVNGS